MARQKQNNPVTFDTLSYAKRLKAAGFTQEQAEVQAETFLAIVQEQLISKRDLKDLESTLELKIEKVRLEVENVKKELKVDIEKIQLEIENTKKDLKLGIENTKKDLRLEIEKVRKDARVNTELLRRDLKIWFGGMLVVAVTVLSGMMTLIVHLAR